MSDRSRLIRLFEAMDGLLERSEPTAWGAVVTDRRFPSIYDANYARVDGRVDASLRDVEAELLPALDASGGLFVHVVAFDPAATPRLVRAMRRSGREVTVDTAMVHAESPLAPALCWTLRDIVVFLPSVWWTGPFPGQPRALTTGSNGRFKLLGVGAERLVRFQKRLLHDVGRIELGLETRVQVCLSQQAQVGTELLQMPAIARNVRLHAVIPRI